MRFWILFILVLLINVPCFSADHGENGNDEIITRPSRPVAPKDFRMGVNGSLKWKKNTDGNEGLALVTASGDTYFLSSTDSDVKAELLSLSRGRDGQVELFGVLENDKTPKKLRVTQIVRKHMDNNGVYIVTAAGELDKEGKQQLYDFLSSLPNTKIVEKSPVTSFIKIQTDFSQKFLELLIRAAGLSDSLDTIEPDANSRF